MQFWNTLMAWVPDFDGQTVVSLFIGLVVSWLTFWWGYKNTVGVREEKIRGANFELAGAVLRRLAVDREPVTAAEFDAIRRTKAYKAAVPERRLWPFGHILDAVLTDIFENNFIDKTAKAAIITLLEASRVSDREAVAKEDAGSKADDRPPVGLLAGASAFAGALSAIAYAVFSQLDAPKKLDLDVSAGSIFLQGVLAIAGTAIAMVAMFKAFTTVKLERQRYHQARFEQQMLDEATRRYDEQWRS